jgi:hypothetical protein
VCLLNNVVSVDGMVRGKEKRGLIDHKVVPNARDKWSTIKDDDYFPRLRSHVAPRRDEGLNGSVVA